MSAQTVECPGTPECTRTYVHVHVAPPSTWHCDHPEWERHTVTTEGGKTMEVCDHFNHSGGGLGHMSRCDSWRYV